MGDVNNFAFADRGLDPRGRTVVVTRTHAGRGGRSDFREAVRDDDVRAKIRLAFHRFHARRNHHGCGIRFHFWRNAASRERNVRAARGEFAFDLREGFQRVARLVEFVPRERIGAGPEQAAGLRPRFDALLRGAGDDGIEHVERVVVLQRARGDLFLGDQLGLKIFVRQREEAGAFVGEAGLRVPIFVGHRVKHRHAARAHLRFSEDVIDLRGAVVDEVRLAIGAFALGPIALGDGVARAEIPVTDHAGVVPEHRVGAERRGADAVHHRVVERLLAVTARAGVVGRDAERDRLMAVPKPTAERHPVADAGRHRRALRELKHVERRLAGEIKRVPAEGDVAAHRGIGRVLVNRLGGEIEHARREITAVFAAPIKEARLRGRSDQRRQREQAHVVPRGLAEQRGLESLRRGPVAKARVRLAQSARGNPIFLDVLRQSFRDGGFVFGIAGQIVERGILERGLGFRRFGGVGLAAEKSFVGANGTHAQFANRLGTAGETEAAARREVGVLLNQFAVDEERGVAAVINNFDQRARGRDDRAGNDHRGVRRRSAIRAAGRDVHLEARADASEMPEGVALRLARVVHGHAEADPLAVFFDARFEHDVFEIAAARVEIAAAAGVLEFFAALVRAKTPEGRGEFAA